VGEQYFTSQPSSKSDRKEYSAKLRGSDVRFVTDRGVFSKSGIDFGSRLLIESLAIPPDSTVLDLGCGYGPLGIAVAVTVASAKVTMLDINERAVLLAQENVRRNAVDARVQLFVGDGANALPDGLRFDVIALNPPIRAGKAVVYRLFAEACARLTDSGHLFTVIQKKQGADSARRYLQSLFINVEIVAKERGYYVYRCDHLGSVS